MIFSFKKIVKILLNYAIIKADNLVSSDRNLSQQQNVNWDYSNILLVYVSED